MQFSPLAVQIVLSFGGGKSRRLARVRYELERHEMRGQSCHAAFIYVSLCPNGPAYFGTLYHILIYVQWAVDESLGIFRGAGAGSHAETGIQIPIMD
jgi:hypothetical protein